MIVIGTKNKIRQRTPVVVVRIYEGLGNQLFQYSAASALAFRSGARLKLDNRSYREKRVYRKYRLGLYRTRGEFINAYDWVRIRFTENCRFPRLKVLVGGVLPFLQMHWLRDREIGYDAAVTAPTLDAYLHGFWHSPKYFADYDAKIREELTLRSEPEGLNRELFEEIHRKNSVCVHIRRSDYIANPALTARHGVCSVAYYEAALDHVAREKRADAFFVFSDDPEWTQQNIRVPGRATFVTHNLDAEYEDLRLMSACRHFIIANSTFSWWGAYLGSSKDKMVIAPERWYAEPSPHEADLIPETWIRM